MKSITTLEEARALPERQPIRILEVIQPDGTTLKIPYFPKLVAVELALARPGNLNTLPAARRLGD